MKIIYESILWVQQFTSGQNILSVSSDILRKAVIYNCKFLLWLKKIIISGSICCNFLSPFPVPLVFSRQNIAKRLLLLIANSEFLGVILFLLRHHLLELSNMFIFSQKVHNWLKIFILEKFMELRNMKNQMEQKILIPRVETCIEPS